MAREYFNSEAAAEEEIRRRWHAGLQLLIDYPGSFSEAEMENRFLGGTFYCKILHAGREKWMLDSKGNNYAGAAFRVLEDLTHTIPQIVQRSAGVQAEVEVRQPEATAGSGPAAELSGADFDKRVEAMAEIRRLKDTTAVPLLIQLLRDGDSRVREEAARTLESLGDVRAVDPLIAALRDLDGNVRLKVARALGVLKDGKAVDPLIVHLRDPDNIVRVFAAYALLRLEDKRAIPALQSALGNTTHGEARQAIQEALAGLGVLTPNDAPPADEYLHFACPRCGTRLKVPRQQAGRQGRCRCGQGVVVPSPEQ